MDVRSYRFGPTFLNYLSCPSNSAYNFGTGSFSVEAWVKSLVGGPVLGTGDPSSENYGGFWLNIDRNCIKFRDFYENSDYSFMADTINICDGKWHHVAAVRSDSSVNIYLDGAKIGNGFTCNDPLNVNSEAQLTIGRHEAGSSPKLFSGYLAEIRLWNVARTSDEIFNNFLRRLTPAEMTSDLVGYWSGEFGIAADFSQTRNSTDVYGTNQGASTCPPIADSYPQNLFREFSGIYDCAIKTQNSDTWTAYGQVIGTSQGFIVTGNSTVMNGVQVDGTWLSWPTTGNPFGACIQLLNWSSNEKYWSAQINRLVFEGTVNFSGQNESVLCRGAIDFIRTGSGVLLNVGTSQFMTCVSPAVGSSVTLCITSGDAESVQSRDMFSYYDIGGIIHADSNLALKPADRDTAGSTFF